MSLDFDNFISDLGLDFFIFKIFLKIIFSQIGLYQKLSFFKKISGPNVGKLQPAPSPGSYAYDIWCRSGIKHDSEYHPLSPSVTARY